MFTNAEKVWCMIVHYLVNNSYHINNCMHEFTQQDFIIVRIISRMIQSCLPCICDIHGFGMIYSFINL